MQHILILIDLLEDSGKNAWWIKCSVGEKLWDKFDFSPIQTEVGLLFLPVESSCEVKAVSFESADMTIDISQQ